MVDITFTAKQMAVELERAKSNAREVVIDLIRGTIMIDKRDTFTKEEVLEFLDIKIVRSGK